MNITLETNVNEIRRVDSNRNYWFIRTYSGNTFDDFYEKGYVGIGFNDIPYEYLRRAQFGKESEIKILKEYISQNYRLEASENTKWTNQLINFQHTISPGDIVMIPDRNSDRYAIGEIESEVNVVEDKRTFKYKEGYEQFPEKRRRVKWLSIREKYEIKAEWGDINFGRSAVTNINDHSEDIEGQITSLYIKDDRAYLVLQINQDEEINAFYFNQFLSSLTYFYHEFCIESGIEINDELFLKIKMQSKGGMSLNAAALYGLLGISLLFAVCNNPTLKAEFLTLKLEATGSGAMVALSDFLDRNEKRRQEKIKFEDSINYLKATRKELEPDSIKNQITDEKK